MSRTIMYPWDVLEILRRTSPDFRVSCPNNGDREAGVYLGPQYVHRVERQFMLDRELVEVDREPGHLHRADPHRNLRKYYRDSWPRAFREIARTIPRQLGRKLVRVMERMGFRLEGAPEWCHV